MNDTTQMVLDTLALLPADFDLGQEMKKAIDSALSTQFFQGGALLAILGGILYQAKSWFMWIGIRINRHLKYSVYIDETNPELFETFTEWFHEKYPKAFRNVNAGIHEYPYKKSPKDKYYVKLMQHFDFNLVWYKGRLLFIEKARETLENSASKTNRHLNFYTIYGFFSKGAILSLLKECRQRYIDNEMSKKKDEGQKIHYNSYNDWWTKTIQRIKTFDNIFFKNKQDLMDDLEQFRKNRKLYERLGIANKRGYLLSGPPGNGKSTIPLAMAKMLDMHIYYLNLSAMNSDTELTSHIADIKDNSIIVFEDIDVLTTKKEKDKASRAAGTTDITMVTFSGLLNTLNGVFEPDNCIVVLTTNHPENLDPALIRAGRVDRHIEIDNPTMKEAAEFMDNFYNETEKNAWVTIANPEHQLSIPMSEVQDYCLRYPEDPQQVFKLITEKVIQL